MKKSITSLSIAALFVTAPFISGQIVYVWTGDATADNYNFADNWSPAGGPPAAGDTGNIGATGDTVGPFRALLTFQGILGANATVNVYGSSYLESNDAANRNVGGTLNFFDESRLISSNLLPQSGAVINWDSSDTWTTAGMHSAPFLTLGNANNVVNMSAGRWDFLGNTHPNSLDVDVGTFNMTGGTIVMDRALRIVGGTFNLGGTGAVRMTADTITLNFFTAGGLNFEGTNSALFLKGADNTDAFNTRIGAGRILIDSVVASSLSEFVVTNVSLDGDDYTRISVIPEPRAYAFLAGIIGLAFFLLRRQNR